MSRQYLRHVITLAKEQETEHPKLLKSLSHRRLSMHSSLRLLAQNLSEDQLLYDFVLAYIQQVPCLLDSAEHLLANNLMGERLLPTLKTAEEFFLEFDASQSAPCLMELLDKAYLAHRLIEEVNELYIKHMGLPLIPLNTTLANVVAHHLIGEQQANQYDAQILNLMARFKQSEAWAQLSILAEQQRSEKSNVLRAWISWPCLSSQLGIQLATEYSHPPAKAALLL